MPLTRYKIGNEYELSDPDLYKTADKDDPEALLEAVAMSGLVGVLRQLGDLAQFAAEIFHDLHEEVMTTAARGHNLIARVQQLEAEVPSIEKAFLSRTDHSSFFDYSVAGVDWHPNLHEDQNMVTRGDLPRFVMDSYGECRGPPRLFLLDKFDIAGAGACLKRYTDPSLFKAEKPLSEIAYAEVQGDKKIRKIKKKGSGWRDGETAEAFPHAKLHQLLLEERIENGHSDRGRIVKLKRRQLNGSPFDAKPGESCMEKILSIPTLELKVFNKVAAIPGESCMEKILSIPTPELKVFNKVAARPALLKSMSDNSSESAVEIHEVIAGSPRKEVLQEEDLTYMSPNAQELVSLPLTNELNVEANSREIMQVVGPIVDDEMNESPFFHSAVIEEEMTDNSDGKTEGSLDADPLDDVTSEVDNYMDALANMESEMDTDNEYKAKNNQGFVITGKVCTGSDTNRGQMDSRVNFSDSQSLGNSSLSDDGTNSSKKGRGSFSCSDSLSNVADDMPSDGEGVILVTENRAAITYLSISAGTPAIESQATIVEDAASIHEDKINVSACTADLGRILPPSVPVSDLLIGTLAEPEEVEKSMSCIEPSSMSNDIFNNRRSVVDHDTLSAISLERDFMDESVLKDPNLSSVQDEFYGTDEQTHRIIKMADVVGDFASSENAGSENEVNFDVVPTETFEAGNVTATAATADEDVQNSDISDVQVSHSSPEVLQLKELDVSDSFSSACVAKLVAQSGDNAKHLKVMVKELDSGTSESIVDDHSRMGFARFVHDVSVAERAQACVHICDDIMALSPSSELSKQEVTTQPNYQSHSPVNHDDCIKAGAPAEHLVDLLVEQNSTNSSQAAVDGVDFKSLNLQNSPASYISEPGILLQFTSKLPSSSTDCVWKQADESNLNPSDIQSEVLETNYHMHRENQMDVDSSSHWTDPRTLGLKPQLNVPEHDPVMTGKPFNSRFPSCSLFPESTHATMEEMPSLPPLPPVQWRIARPQPSVVFLQQNNTTQDNAAFSVLQPLKTHKEAQPGSPLLASGTMHSPEPILPLNIADSEMSERLSEEYLGSTLGSATGIIDDAITPHDGTPSPKSFLVILEASNKRAEHGFSETGSESMNSCSDPTIAVKYQTSWHDTVISQGLPIHHSSRLTPECSEAMATDHSTESVVSPIMKNESHCHDSVTSQEEIAWPPASLTLPLTYEAGRVNGNKLPRPRNPLIDAVCALDKNKLKKVSERVLPEIGSKSDDRDSMLEQIRTKSFNLKPASASRPRIKGIHGPNTNLNVAAILEKANAIRQALAGSDEDDDSDSWSDS